MIETESSHAETSTSIAAASSAAYCAASNVGVFFWLQADQVCQLLGGPAVVAYSLLSRAFRTK